MLLKGILLVFIGISGVVITMIWIIKALLLKFQRPNTELSMIINDFSIDNEIDETVLLKEEEY